jgi:copper homeostasis protein
VARRYKPAAEVTFHRAFDAALAAGFDPAEALARLEQAGADRVLTSGGSPDSALGLGMIGRLVELGRIHAPSVQVMAGGGVTLELIPSLLERGVRAVHTSARTRSGLPSGARATAADPALAAAMAAAVAGKSVRADSVKGTEA